LNIQNQAIIFNYGKLAIIKNSAVSNDFVLPINQWIEKTNGRSKIKNKQNG
jgi:hypothetical protein